MFSPLQLYFPLSDIPALLIIRVDVPLEFVAYCEPAIAWLFFNQVMLGAGKPSIWHDSVMVELILTMIERLGFCMTTGGARIDIIMQI